METDIKTLKEWQGLADTFVYEDMAPLPLTRTYEEWLTSHATIEAKTDKKKGWAVLPLSWFSALKTS